MSILNFLSAFQCMSESGEGPREGVDARAQLWLCEWRGRWTRWKLDHKVTKMELPKGQWIDELSTKKNRSDEKRRSAATCAKSWGTSLRKAQAQSSYTLILRGKGSKRFCWTQLRAGGGADRNSCGITTQEEKKKIPLFKWWLQNWLTLWAIFSNQFIP